MPAPKRTAPKSSKPPRTQPAGLTHGTDLLTERVRTALADVPAVREKKMFGSTGFLVRGKLCITSRESRLMLRIDPADHDDALKRAGCTTVVMKGRPYRGYVFVTTAAVKTTRALNHWLTLALDYNRRAFK